jgi:hypothetical protein
MWVDTPVSMNTDPHSLLIPFPILPAFQLHRRPFSEATLSDAACFLQKNRL